MSANDNVIPFPGRWHGDPDDSDDTTGEPPGDDPESSWGPGPEYAAPEPPGAHGTDFVAQLFAEVMHPGEPAPAPQLATPPREVLTHLVRVDLDHSDPVVWRLLELRGDTPLDELHHVLQCVIGWQASHAHAFAASPTDPGGPADPARWGRRSAPFLTDLDEADGQTGVPERRARLDQVLREAGDQLFYEYDFGDGWEHTLTLVSSRPLDESDAPRCLDGARACPPEDCGGPGGYEAVLEALATPAREREPDQLALLDWLPTGWSPDAFSVDATNATLDRMLAVTSPPDAESVAPPLHDLLTRCSWGPHSPLAHLMTDAELEREGLPDPEVRAQMVRPFLHLLELVGDGLTLTGAGYLKPAVVQTLAEAMPDAKIWGKANREEHTAPVAHLRRTATDLGLLRKAKGTLRPTRLAGRIGDDPDQMWDLITASLPLGKQEPEQHGGVIALLATAAGRPAYEALRTTGNDIMNEAGWRLTDPDASSGLLGSSMAYECARPTVDALRVLSALGSGVHAQVTTSGRQLARQVLRGQQGTFRG